MIEIIKINDDDDNHNDILNIFFMNLLEKKHLSMQLFLFFIFSFLVYFLEFIFIFVDFIFSFSSF
jgi:hypothetical protein